ncbi:MAG TPA: SRPBCC family protein [Pyrinomonadaceae bacterium]|nr:SRPBCC family protein [Pyrinomonadaceae bacterium]
MVARQQSGGTAQTFRQQQDSQHASLSNETNYTSERYEPGLPSSNAKRLARGLGWFSLALGTTELLAPRFIARISGVSEDRTGMIRLFGLREIASGIGIFAQKNPAGAMWSRVAGDALDLTALGVACTSPDAKRGRITFATANVLAVTALDVIAARQLSSGNQGVQANASCIVSRDPDEVYSFWRDFRNLPRFMEHLVSVDDMGNGRSHWVAKGPAGTTVEWDAMLVADDPGRVITWRSLENSDVDNAGAVRFEPAPGGRGTIIKVNLQYNPPAGIVGATVARLFGEEPNQQLDDDMRRFKQVMEVGEVVVSDATVFGTGYFDQRPAQPPDPRELQRPDAATNQMSSSPRSSEGRRDLP